MPLSPTVNNLDPPVKVLLSRLAAAWMLVGRCVLVYNGLQRALECVWTRVEHRWVMTEEQSYDILLERALDKAKEAGMAFVRAWWLARAARASGQVPEPWSPQQMRQALERRRRHGLLRWAGIGDHLLIDPDVLDDQLAQLRQVARADAQRQGQIAESSLVQGASWPTLERCPGLDAQQRRLLRLMAAMSLIEGDRALRRKGQLLLPESVEDEPPEIFETAFMSRVAFKGPVDAIYGRLVTRLSRSRVFSLERIWKRGAWWRAHMGGRCAIELNVYSAQIGELSLRYDGAAKSGALRHFESYVVSFLEGAAQAGTVSRKPGFVCGSCGTPVTALQAERRLERGLRWMSCCVCDQKLKLIDPMGPDAHRDPPVVVEMSRAVTVGRSREAAALEVVAKEALGEPDVLVLHRPGGQRPASRIGSWLSERGMLAWLDPWERSGPLEPDVVSRLSSVRLVAVVVDSGKERVLEQPAVRQVLMLMRKRGRRLAVLMLPGFDGPAPELSSKQVVVDFRDFEGEPILELIEAIKTTSL